MELSNLSAIAACDPQGVLGKAGKLPWHCPQDLDHFSAVTRHQIIVMGFQTYLNFPKFYFEKRLGIVFSRQHRPKNEVIFVRSLEEFLELKKTLKKEIYIIGGAQLYTLFLKANLIKKVILTKLKHSYNGDTFFPLSLIQDWPRQTIQENSLFSIYHYFNPGYPKDPLTLL